MFSHMKQAFQETSIMSCLIIHIGKINASNSSFLRNSQSQNLNPLDQRDLKQKVTSHFH
jgi:hypothetical protein